jgi:alpha-amylase/alpha-mannosidase (GH57 family)
MEANAAVDDLLGHLAAIGRACDEPLVSIILDGENPWEHYPHGGKAILDRLYEALERRERAVQPVLLSERLAREPPTVRLQTLHAGSWIDANFRIWIGHEEDRAAWEALGAVRKLWDQAGGRGVPDAALTQAREEILIAEGSDWFWWFGDDFVTESAVEFDALFRDRLRAACRHLGVEPPRSLQSPISSLARQEIAAVGCLPDALLHPTIDGRPPSYGE